MSKVAKSSQDEIKLPRWIFEWYRGANDEMCTLEDVFDNLKHDVSDEVNDNEMLKNKISNYGGYSKIYQALSYIYFNRYEVEPEFEVLDWVVYIPNNSIWKISKDVHGDGNAYNLMNEHDFMNVIHNSDLRHATPKEIAEEKERRWWAKHGRDVNEYRVGDIIVECDGYFGVITELPKEYPSQERDDDMSDESNYYVKIDPDWRPCDYQTRHVEDLEIVCFVENRLDA